MAVGDKSHLNNYQRAATPVIVNPNRSPMSFSGAASVPNIINPFEETRTPMNFSGVASTSAEPVTINRNPSLFDDSGWMSDNMDLTYDIPADDMQANYEYEAYGGSRGPDWSFNPIPPNTTPSEPNRTPAPVNTTGGGRAQPSGPAPIPQVLISQDLTRRPQTGNIYSPDLSAYYDSSLFNYTGPGGVDEYTYGQGLRTGGADYSIFGSPTDIANPYYEGQFTPVTQPVVSQPVGPADGAINMNPVQLPSDLPQIEVSADVSMPGFVGGSLPTDLTYQQTIDEMGIDLLDAPRTTFPSPRDMTETDKQYQDMLNQSLMDNQTQAELAMGDRSGFPNDVVTASIPGMAMDDTADIEQGMITSQRGTTMDDTDAIERGMRESQRGTTMDDTTAIQMGMMQGRVNPQTGLPIPEFNTLPEQGLTPLQQAARDAAGNIDTRDFRFSPTGEQDKSFLQKWVEGGPAYQPTSDADIKELEDVGNQVREYADKTSQIRNLFDENVINTVGSPNQFEIQRAETDANQAALDRARYNAQINNPTADFSGYMRNYGSGFVEPQTSISDVTDATPMQIANNAGQMEIANTSIFDAKREDSPFAKGPAQEIKNIFDEQQNYEVPASEMSPGEVGLVNGLLEGAEAVYQGAFSVDGSGTDRVKTPEESAAWDKYYSYKSAGIDALNKGEIDVKAFNELKGKAGSDTVINHFVDTNKNPLINNSIANTANVLYQAMDVITGDDTIKEGITDFFQQKKGVDDDTPLGSIGEEIAKAKKATQQRKEVQENIFTPGPMKFAAVASKPKPTPVKSSPAIRTSSQKNVISKPKAKPGGRAGAGATTNKYSSFARNYGGRYGL